MSARLSGAAWTIVAVAALFWPARMAGWTSGIPLDTVLAATVLGLIVPLLWWFCPQFVRTRRARISVALLLAWKAVCAVALAQDGWCARFVTPVPFVQDSSAVLHTWDVRADWRSATPACSAIVVRRYREQTEFPAWFFNLPPILNELPGPNERPPGARLTMTATGYLRSREPGELQILIGSDMTGTLRVDDAAVSRLSHEAPTPATMTAGIHKIAVEAELTGTRWRFEPLWNGRDLWSNEIATVTPPTRLDIAARPWGRYIPAAIVGTLVVMWLGMLLRRIRSLPILVWTAAASVLMGGLAVFDVPILLRCAIPFLAIAIAVPLPQRLHNVFGTFLLIGVPWLAFIAVRAAPQAGHFLFYTPGDDFWMFQRYAYRIFLQGYWLEGGQPTFWYQPLYRWLAGLLHVVFGDSSIGEMYWDAGCLLASALFTFHVVKVFSGFRWGVAAAIVTLTAVVVGPNWYLLGRGLAENTSAGFLYLGALFALRGRSGNQGAIVAAGLLAILAFYTRLNNLPMACAVAAFAFPIVKSVHSGVRPVRGGRWSAAVMLGVPTILFVGVLLFTLRTWYYTGHFATFYGTQREMLSNWPSGATVWQAATRVLGSLSMTLTMSDPPRFDPRAFTLLFGAFAAVLAVLNVQPFGQLPLSLVIFLFAGVSAAVVARGSAYPGRFSLHLIPVATALTICAAQRLTKSARGAHPLRREADSRTIEA
jgi:hypothetical protein